MTGPRGIVDELTPTQTRVLSLMAEGLSNKGIAQRLFVSEQAVEKQAGHVLWKTTGLFHEPGPLHNRRVLAVLKYLEAGPA